MLCGVQLLGAWHWWGVTPSPGAARAGGDPAWPCPRPPAPVCLRHSLWAAGSCSPCVSVSPGRGRL